MVRRAVLPVATGVDLRVGCRVVGCVYGNVRIAQVLALDRYLLITRIVNDVGDAIVAADADVSAQEQDWFGRWELRPTRPDPPTP